MPSRPLFFFLFSSSLPLFRSGCCCCTPAKLFIGGLLAQIPFISISLDRDREFFSTFSLFFLLSSFDIYHVSRRNERECFSGDRCVRRILNFYDCDFSCLYSRFNDLLEIV